MGSFGFFSTIFSAPTAAVRSQAEPAVSLPIPEKPICLLGDLHGRADLLARFLKLRRRHFPGHQLIVLGDMIDRGEGGAEALRILRAETGEGAVCLMGNHEAMMLEFLDDPAESGKRWLAHGGLETVASFGLRGIPQDSAALIAVRDALRERMGAETETWVRDLPLLWRSGNLVAVHAALDPALPIEEQTPRHLVWGHPAFMTRARTDGLWVAHGHTAVERAHLRRGRIALDTAAYATGALSYALIDPAAPEIERVTLGVVPH